MKREKRNLINKMERENLLQKTFHATSAEEIDRLVNEFREENDIKYTQSHITYIESVIFYDYIVFYLPKIQGTDQPQQKKVDKKECPGCGEVIPASFEYHMKCGWSK